MSDQQEQPRIPDPPDSIELGRATWTYLHSLAAAYPDKASPQQAETMKTYVKTFANTYPCSVCAEDFQDIVQHNPPDTRSRASFSMWMCEAHNEVNRRLGKPTMNCPLFVRKWLEDVYPHEAPSEMSQPPPSSGSSSSSSSAGPSASSGGSSSSGAAAKSSTCGTTFCTLDKFKSTLKH